MRRLRLRLRRWIFNVLAGGLRALTPQPDFKSENLYLSQRLDRETLMREALERSSFSDAHERVAELVEARAMAGAGPWNVPEAVTRRTDQLIGMSIEALKQANPAEYFATQALELQETANLRETSPLLAQGAFGDIQLALQNLEWRREINLSWLEFSRWGIQQIILICRLHYIKNPTIQRGINVAAQYVFGRGVEVSSPDPDANDVLREFMARNSKVLGQVGLTELERAKYYDGNLFFAFFSDTMATGKTTIRTIDATEIMDVVTDPGDTATPWFYRREWTERRFNIANGQVTTQAQTAWYPAVGYDPDDKPELIGGKPVMWKTPVYHRKCGAIAKWHFGCPLAYAALDWARAAKRFLEACATVKNALAQISMILTTKGGQAALEAQKQALSTTVGPQTSIWDENPTAVNGSIFGSGPGTTLQAFKTSGAGGDPEEVRRFELMVWRVFGIPETFGGDVKTGNLATATSLDRPTELNFLEKQEAWREDLIVIGKFVLMNSLQATGGQLAEAWNKRQAKTVPGKVVVMEAARISKKGQTVRYRAANPSDDKIEVMVTFPSIREGDMPALVDATVAAMTLGNSQGTVLGIDEKAGVRKLYEHCDIENGDELIDEQYPETGTDAYDPLRTKDDELTPPAAGPGGVPTVPPQPKPEPQVKEATRRVLEAARRLARRRAA